jgi:hypothetical protein
MFKVDTPAHSGRYSTWSRWCPPGPRCLRQPVAISSWPERNPLK